MLALLLDVSLQLLARGLPLETDFKKTHSQKNLSFGKPISFCFAAIAGGKPEEDH